MCAHLKNDLKESAQISTSTPECARAHCARECTPRPADEAQAADFYTPNQFTDTIVLSIGSPWIRQWPDHELVNNKPRWESLGVINGNLISGVHYNYGE